MNWLAQNPRYTQRFAQHVGTLCQDMSNKAVAQLLHLHEHTVKALDIRYMQAWLARTPQLAPPESWAWMRYRSRRGTRIASWSAIWSAAARFGSVGRAGHVEGVPQLGAGSNLSAVMQ